MKTNMKASSIVVSLTLLSMVGCGGGGGSSDPVVADPVVTPPTVTVEPTGQFIDSAVEGLRYVSDNGSGVTDSDGNFTTTSDTVSFFIGNIPLGSASNNSIITPLDLVTVDDASSDVFVNIARVFVTLDTDSNPDNGITLPANVGTGNVTALNFDQPTADFEVDATVTSFIGGEQGLTLVDATTAIDHFSSTLDNLPDSKGVLVNIVNTTWIEERRIVQVNANSCTSTWEVVARIQDIDNYGYNLVEKGDFTGCNYTAYTAQEQADEAELFVYGEAPEDPFSNGPNISYSDISRIAYEAGGQETVQIYFRWDPLTQTIYGRETITASIYDNRVGNYQEIRISKEQ